MIRVTIYNEGVHEKRENENVGQLYPEGMHGAIKKGIEDDEIVVKTVTLDTIDELTQELLDETDVLIWWGHTAHHLVPDEVAERVKNAVLCGMGFIPLHSAHYSKPFHLLMGTGCGVHWREDGDYEYLWNIAPSHPITRGIGRYFKLEHEETYSEPFQVPEPDKLIFIGSYEGGEVFRSGCCYRRGYGKIFYFQPGHETFPTYYDKNVLTVIKNAVHWAYPDWRDGSALETPFAGKIEQ